VAGFFTNAGNAALEQQMENVDLSEGVDKGRGSRCCLNPVGQKHGIK